MSIAISLLFFLVTDDAPKPAERLKQLHAKRETIEKTFRWEPLEDRMDEGVCKANDKYHATRRACHKAALDAVRKNPDLPEAFEVIATLLNTIDFSNSKKAVVYLGVASEVMSVTDRMRFHVGCPRSLSSGVYGTVAVSRPPVAGDLASHRSTILGATPTDSEAPTPSPRRTTA
jgi:hypothetical protein